MQNKQTAEMGYCLQLVSTLTLVLSSGSAMVHVTDYWPEAAEDLLEPRHQLQGQAGQGSGRLDHDD